MSKKSPWQKFINWLSRVFRTEPSPIPPKPMPEPMPPASLPEREFVATTFLFADAPLMGKDNTLQFFSPQYTDTHRQAFVDRLIHMGANAIVFLIANQDGPLRPYKAGWSGDWDEAYWTRLHAWAVQCRQAGLWCVPIIMCDDSPLLTGRWDIPSWQQIEHRLLIERTAQVIVKYCKFPMVGLEVNEYWHEWYVDLLCDWGQKAFKQLVGCHVQGDWQKYAKQPHVGFIGIEMAWHPKDGKHKTPEKLYDDLSGFVKLANRPVLAAEWTINTDELARRQSLAAAFAGTVGVLNGFHPQLAEYLRNVPMEIMTRERHGSIATLAGNGIKLTADLKTGIIRKE